MFDDWIVTVHTAEVSLVFSIFLGCLCFHWQVPLASLLSKSSCSCGCAAASAHSGTFNEKCFFSHKSSIVVSGSAKNEDVALGRCSGMPSLLFLIQSVYHHLFLGYKRFFLKYDVCMSKPGKLYSFTKLDWNDTHAKLILCFRHKWQNYMGTTDLFLFCLPVRRVLCLIMAL